VGSEITSHRAAKLIWLMSGRLGATDAVAALKAAVSDIATDHGFIEESPELSHETETIVNGGVNAMARYVLESGGYGENEPISAIVDEIARDYLSAGGFAVSS
jgi:hypothetical protein